MALYAFDGTGNLDKSGNEIGDPKDSNVLVLFRGYGNAADRNEDAHAATGSLYLTGIGNRAKEFVGKEIAEAFGIGGHRRVNDALARLDRNFAAGDTVIDVVGFSRGAATAISFANKLAERHPERQIRFIGVFDIVGEFGLPGKLLNAGHNLNFPPNVLRCYHAMALDEHRGVFQLTRLSDSVPDDKKDRLMEVWFRGVHSDVGGGNGNEAINTFSLNWMYRMARLNLLPISDAAIEANLKRRTKDPMVDHKFEVGPKRRIRNSDFVHISVRDEPGEMRNNPGPGLARIDDDGNIVQRAAGASGAASGT